jgi:hypothetical protein
MQVFENTHFWIKKIIAIMTILFIASPLIGRERNEKFGTVALDTLEKVSMIFEVKYKEANSLDIRKHPVLRRSSESFIFATNSELPTGLLLSDQGSVSWSPSAEQFRKLKEAPYLMNFHAHSGEGSYINGEIRIIALGEIYMNTVEVDSIESISDQDESENTSESVAQNTEPISMIYSSKDNWDTQNEGESFNIEFSAKGGSGDYKFELLQPDYLMENLDQYGRFSWTPDFDFVSPDEVIKSVLLKIKVFDTEGNEYFESVPIYVNHVNRPPIVNEIPTFYIQHNKENIYQLKKEGLTYDPDGDSIIFKPVLKELPQGVTLSLNGTIKWKPSRSQFNYLRQDPIYLSFTVQDYPGGEKSMGQLKIEVSQVDLPPEIVMIPNKERFEINENEGLNLNFFITDPNGEMDLLTFDFATENSSIPSDSLTKKDDWQYEFKWTPGYDFIKQEGEKNEFDISFFAIDKESNQTQKNILVTVVDTENVLEKDRILYDQYRTVLERAFDMITQLNEKEKELEKKYKQAKNGKKKRAISTASLGALTGLSPVIFINNPDGQKIAAGLGGTATATIGTLEASNVIGEPPSDIMRDLNYVSQKRNDLLVYGNVFASKYALPVDKREKGFQSDLRSLTIQLNLKDTAKLDLDATWENKKAPTARNIKKIFKDFNKDERFEKDYE